MLKEQQVNDSILPNQSVQQLDDYVLVGSNYPDDSEMTIESKEAGDQRHLMRNTMHLLQDS